MGEYNTIADADLDTDSPYDTDVAAAMRENVNYNHDHALRCGTDDDGNRLVFARWLEVLDSASAGANEVFSGSVTFDGGAEDGNPNFSAAPTMVFGFLEYNVPAYDSWNATNGIYAWSVTLTALSDTGFSWRVQFWNDAAVDIFGYLTWFAYAEATVGE